MKAALTVSTTQDFFPILSLGSAGVSESDKIDLEVAANLEKSVLTRHFRAV